MNKTAFTAIIILTMGIALFYSGYNIKPKPNKDVSLTRDNLLYPGLSWQKVADTSQFFYETVNITNNETNDTNSISLPGSVWKYSQEIATTEDLNSDTTWGNIINYYSQQLQQKGWLNSINTSSYTISTVNADGDGASQMGFLKVDKDNIKVISLISETSFASGEFPINASCPCKSSYYVFESDETPIKRLLE